MGERVGVCDGVIVDEGVNEGVEVLVRVAVGEGSTALAQEPSKQASADSMRIENHGEANLLGIPGVFPANGWFFACLQIWSKPPFFM